MGILSMSCNVFSRSIPFTQLCTVAVKSLFPYHSRTAVVVRASVRFRTVRNVAEVQRLFPPVCIAVRNPFTEYGSVPLA